MDQHHVEYITEKALAVTTQEIEQEPGSGCGVPLVFYYSYFFIAVATCLLIPKILSATNEQVDVWLWLQHHLLSDEEAGPHCLLLRSLPEPHFGAAAAPGHWLCTSTKGNGTDSAHSPADTASSVSSRIPISQLCTPCVCAMQETSALAIGSATCERLRLSASTLRNKKK